MHYFQTLQPPYLAGSVDSILVCTLQRIWREGLKLIKKTVEMRYQSVPAQAGAFSRFNTVCSCQGHIESDESYRHFVSYKESPIFFGQGKNCIYTTDVEHRRNEQQPTLNTFDAFLFSLPLCTCDSTRRWALVGWNSAAAFCRSVIPRIVAADIHQCERWYYVLDKKDYKTDATV